MLHPDDLLVAVSRALADDRIPVEAVHLQRQAGAVTGILVYFPRGDPMPAARSRQAFHLRLIAVAGPDLPPVTFLPGWATLATEEDQPPSQKSWLTCK